MDKVFDIFTFKYVHDIPYAFTRNSNKRKTDFRIDQILSIRQF